LGICQFDVELDVLTINDEVWGTTVKHLIDVIVAFILATSWIAGIVFAKGFWLTLLACCFPFYAWYLVVEQILIGLGINI
jgi:hypothetical protein